MRGLRRRVLGASGRLGLAGLLGLGLGACGGSGLVLDGRPFEVAECHSGQAWGFRGVDLTDREGRRLFVAWTAQQKAKVTVFAAPPEAAVELGLCGEIDVTSDGAVQEPEAVSGALSVSCRAAGHAVEGAYVFRQCR